FQDLYLLLVFHRHRLLAGDGEVVEAQTGGQVQRITADGDVLVVADRRVVVAQRGVLAGQFAQRADLAVVDLLAADDGDRGGRVVQRRVAVAVQAGAGCGVAVGHGLHVDGRQIGGARLRVLDIGGV